MKKAKKKNLLINDHEIVEMIGNFIKDGNFELGDSSKEWDASKDALLTNAKVLFPHGHPEFIIKVIEEMELHSNKNFDYAFGGDPCGNFKRVANFLKMYPGLDITDPAIVAFIYALKQIDAYLWIKSNGHKTKTEGKSARLRDVSVYSKIIDILDSEGGE